VRQTSKLKEYCKSKIAAFGRHLGLGFAPLISPRRSTVSLIDEYALEDSFEYFREHLQSMGIFSTVQDLHSWLAGSVLRDAKNGYFLEFGYYMGASASRLAPALEGRSECNIYYAFDSFFGLRNEWNKSNGFIGSFDLAGMPPDPPEGVELIVGWVEDTLEPWLQSHKGPVAFAHLDMDVYPPTRYVLETIRDRLTTGSILLFDEFHGYHGWREHEFRAFNEVFGPGTFKFLALGPHQVVISIE
jgi:hypothetical protein